MEQQRFGRPATIPVGPAFESYSGINRTKQFELINQRKVRSVMIGRRRFIITDSYHEFIEDELRQQAAA